MSNKPKQNNNAPTHETAEQYNKRKVQSNTQTPSTKPIDVNKMTGNKNK